MTLQQFLALGAVIILAINCGGGGNQQGNVCQEDNECPPTQFCFNGYCVAASGQSGITVDPVDQNAGSEEMTVSDSRSDKSSPQLDKALSDVVLGTAADAGDAGGATPDMLDVTEAPDVSETDTLAGQPTPDVSKTDTLAGQPTPDVSKTDTLAGQPTPNVSKTDTLADKPTPDVSETDTLADKPTPDVSETDTLADKPTPDGSESAVGCF
ncbi:MAG: hypothetical protein V3S55_02085, partial [Nitrospiraceae bacterium]